MPTPQQAPADIIMFLGHFHPLLVHLPIGLLLLLAVVELLSRRPRFSGLAQSRGVIITLAAIAAVCSAACGLMLSEAGGYDAQLLQWHKWTGIAVAGGSLLTALLCWRGMNRAYTFALAGTVGVLMVASHHGGSLTHGRDYLTKYAPAPLRALLGGGTGEQKKITDPMQAMVFADLVQPIFARNCVACHGPEKQKGKLRLDSLEALKKGGEDGPAFVAGKSGASRMIKFMLLPPEAEEHMPPAGKAQPSDDEIALIQWWIDAGAPADKKVADLTPPVKVARLLDKMYGTPEPPLPPKPLAEVLPVAQQLSGELGVTILPVAQNQPWLNCNANVATKEFGDAELAKLAPLKANLQWLDLGGTKVTDAGMAEVAGMKNLTRLHLEKTAVTDAGVARLAKLRQLEYLNLYGTQVTDDSLAHLELLPELRKLYVWQTKVTSNAVAAFSAAVIDQQQIDRWKQEIASLETKIKNETIDVSLGTPVAGAEPVAAAKPINTKCPITGKDIDPTKTVVYEGKVIAFCCDNCVAEFKKNPAGCLAKLGLTAEAKPAEAKPINTKCPISDEDINPAKTVVYEGKVIAFCCDNCKAKFEKDPKPFLAKLGLTAKAEEKK